MGRDETSRYHMAKSGAMPRAETDVEAAYGSPSPSGMTFLEKHGQVAQKRHYPSQPDFSPSQLVNRNGSSDFSTEFRDTDEKLHGLCGWQHNQEGIVPTETGFSAKSVPNIKLMPQLP